MYNSILEMRNTSKRVSNMFVRILALKMFQPILVDGTFPERTCIKTLHGWKCWFITQKKLKFRLRKSGENESEKLTST